MTSPNETDRLIEHSYDGIQEYDNPMPRWWVITFWLTIVFSVFYYLNPGNTGEGVGAYNEYEADMTAFRAKHPVNEGGADEPALLAMAKTPTAVAAGKTVYAQRCAACHAVDGGGGIGPNLADSAWIHGGTIGAVHKTIEIGVLAKGMPNWGKILSPTELNSVTVYVWSLNGTTPAQPKPPQGEVVTR
jgi:cytochrome c oxidase cbb3-type subunit III